MKTIYLADDDEDILESLADYLSLLLSCRVMRFPDGGSLISALKTGPAPELVISDFCMPNGTGLDVWAFLQAESPAIPFILHSSVCREAVPAVAVQAGLVFVPKGDPDRLCAAVHSALEQEESLDRAWPPYRGSAFPSATLGLMS